MSESVGDVDELDVSVPWTVLSGQDYGLKVLHRLTSICLVVYVTIHDAKYDTIAKI